MLMVFKVAIINGKLFRTKRKGRRYQEDKQNIKQICEIGRGNKKEALMPKIQQLITIS